MLTELNDIIYPQCTIYDSPDCIYSCVMDTVAIKRKTVKEFIKEVTLAKASATSQMEKIVGALKELKYAMVDQLEADLPKFTR